MREVLTSHFRAATIGLLLGCALCGLLAKPTSAQRTSPNVWEEKAVPKPAPPPTTNPRPTGRRNPPVRTAPPVRRITLLTVQWRLLKFTEDGLRKVVSVNDNFSPQDRLMLAVKANQNGYLYVIRQPAPDRDGQLFFPSKHYNAGQNYVRKDQEFILPSDCSDFAVPCWFSLSPPAGKESLTLIFSRNEIKELPTYAPPNGPVLNVQARLVSDLLAASKQELLRIPGALSDRYTVWVRNNNAENNDEIIETLTFNKTTGTNAAAGNATVTQN